MTQKIILRSLVVLAVLAMTSLAIAQEPHHMMKMQCGGGPCLPDLTEEQQTQIEKSKLNLDKAILPLNAELDVKKAELDQLLLAEKPDKKAVYKKIDEIGSVKTQIKKMKVDHRLEVRALLTPEQRVAFDKQHSKCGKRFDKMGRHWMGEGMGKTVKIKKMMGKPCPMESQKEMDVEKKMETEE
jgi:Spy/CpxP family protein refolding chaperone